MFNGFGRCLVVSVNPCVIYSCDVSQSFLFYEAYCWTLFCNY